jgi:sugar lactone lactonase YvrE
MRVGWKLWTIVAGLGAGFCGAADAQRDRTPTANLPNPPDAPYHFVADWPKPLPNNWVMNEVHGVTVDKDDHIWLLIRPNSPVQDKPPFNPANGPGALDKATRKMSPPVLEFDAAGNLLQAWGGPSSMPAGIPWPERERTIVVDSKGHVWLSGANPGDGLFEFTNDGKFVRDFGHRGPVVERKDQKMDNQRTDVLPTGAAGMWLDEANDDMYIADGYLNRRLLVYSISTFKFKRGWGAYGKPLAQVSNADIPHDPNDFHAPEFGNPVQSVAMSKDGLVYFGDRGGDRIQVFTRDGKYLKEFYVANATMRGGSVMNIAFSPDPAQSRLFVPDMVNGYTWELDRQSGQIIGKLGHPGTGPGEFAGAHESAVDSKGNVYIGENGANKRAQKWAPN